MKMIDISSIAIRSDKYQFCNIVSHCEYYAVALPYTDVKNISYLLFASEIKVSPRIVRAEDLKYFANVHRVVIQNNREVFMNFDGGTK